jgi:hypothetical protein
MKLAIESGIANSLDLGADLIVKILSAGGATLTRRRLAADFGGGAGVSFINTMLAYIH